MVLAMRIIVTRILIFLDPAVIIDRYYQKTTKTVFWVSDDDKSRGVFGCLEYTQYLNLYVSY